MQIRSRTATGLLVLTTILSAQSDAQSGTGVVLIPTLVLDQKDHFVPDLTKNNFQAFDDGRECPIEKVSQEGEPVSVALVIDPTSAPLRKYLPESVMRQLFGRAGSDDEFYVVGVGDHAEILSDWTSNVDLLLSRVLPFKHEHAQALYDSLEAAVQGLKTAHHKRRVLLVLGDAEENHSRIRQREVQAELRESHARVFVIALPIWSVHELGPLGEAALEKAAEENGGRYLRLTRERDLPLAVETLDLRDEYVLAVRPQPDNVASHSHKLKVTLSGAIPAVKPRVYSRRRYDATKPD